MPLVLNCECDCDYPTKTLAELRQMVYDGLGFIDPLTFASKRNLGQLRADVISRIGFIDKLEFEVETLANLRALVKTRLGLATAVLTNTYTVAYMVGEILVATGNGTVMSNPPPGARAEAVGYINEAQQTLWRRLELDKAGATLPTTITLDADVTTLDGALVLTMAKGMAKAHRGDASAKVYFDDLERLLAAYAQRTPPNIDNIITAALQEAQRTIYRRYEVGASGAISLDPFVNDGDDCSVDRNQLVLVTLANLKAKAKQEDAKICMEEAERYFADMMRRRPPNIITITNTALQSAHRTVLRRFEMGASGAQTPATFTTDSDEPSCDDQPVYLLACANLMVHYKIDDAKLAMSEYESFMKDALARSPPNRKTVVDRLLKTAQETLFRRYDVFRTERWYTWTFVANERFYGIGENDENSGEPTCTKTIDPRKVTWVGVSDGQDNCWRPLRKGIPPAVYQNTMVGVPTHYEIRQCIEVWCTPIAGWKLRVKGHFEPAAFEADDDVNTVDWQAIYLRALADAKLAYKQPDALAADSTAKVYIGDLVAGSHMTARYVPGAREPFNAVRPVMAQADS
jgi:hypothetical protein